MQHPGIVNRSMEVLEKDGGIIFMRKLREGATAESYGIHVARLAGLSPSVLARAEQIMERLRERDAGLRAALPDNFEIKGDAENNPVGNQNNTMINKKTSTDLSKSGETVDIAPKNETPAAFSSILREMFHLDPNRLTPLEALGLINEWKQRLSEMGIYSKSTESVHPQKDKNGLHPKKVDTTPSLFD
jgi:DNA mismatch repair protein MutS